MARSVPKSAPPDNKLLRTYLLQQRLDDRILLTYLREQIFPFAGFGRLYGKFISRIVPMRAHLEREKQAEHAEGLLPLVWSASPALKGPHCITEKRPQALEWTVENLLGCVSRLAALDDTNVSARLAPGAHGLACREKASHLRKIIIFNQVLNGLRLESIRSSTLVSTVPSH